MVVVVVVVKLVVVVVGGVVVVVVVVVVGAARNQHESRASLSCSKQETCAGPVNQHNQGDCPQAELRLISHEL